MLERLCLGLSSFDSYKAVSNASRDLENHLNSSIVHRTFAFKHIITAYHSKNLRSF